MHGLDDLAAVDALQVDGGDPEVAVAELALDYDQRHAFACHLDGVGVAQLVRREAAPNPGRGGRAPQLRACRSGRPVAPAGAAVDDARFSRVIYRGERLRCVRPGGRGLFGNAVLTAAAIKRTDTRDFEAQAGPERRRWLCATTRVDVDVCTAHLNTRSAVEAAGNRAQCAELAALLARRAATRSVIFGGDVNRRGSCAPDGVWTRTDRSADQAPGLQHVYGGGGLRSPSAQVVPATHSDHDVLLVRAHLTRATRR